MIKQLRHGLLVATLLLLSMFLATQTIHPSDSTPRSPFTEGTLRALDTAKVVAPVLTTKTYDYSYGNSHSPLTNLVATWNNTAPVSSLPWIVVVHGGSWSAGDNVRNESGASRVFASHGFAVFNVDYRLLPDTTGAQQEADVLAAINYVRAHWGTFKVNPAKGALYGFSAGGHLVTLIGLSHPGLVQAIVSASGVVQPQRLADDALGMRPTTEPGSAEDSYILARMDQWTGCNYTTVPTDPTCAAKWAAFEPQTFLRANSAPIFMISGSLDPYVTSQMNAAFNYWMDQAHTPHQTILAQGFGHTEAEWMSVTVNAQAMLKFLVAHLHGGSW